MNIQEYRAAVRSNKRSAIIEAGMQVFSRLGFARAGMAEIARQADVSTATLYKHFESKDELFSEIAVLHITPFHAQAESLMPNLQLSEEPVQALIDLSLPFTELLMHDQVSALFRLIIAEGDRFPELKEVIYRHGRDPFKQRLVQVLQVFEDRDLIQISQPAAAAEFYIGMLSYWLLFSPIFNTSIAFGPKQIQHIVRESALMFLARFDTKSGAIVGQFAEVENSLKSGDTEQVTSSLDALKTFDL